MATRNFSIGLLKTGFDPSNSLIAGHDLDEVTSDHSIFSGGRHFMRRRVINEPWWIGYFRLPNFGRTGGVDGLSFFPIGDRWCYINFGFAYHKIENEALEYDFGMKAAAVLVNPEALRSTDSVEPSVARRRRTQVANSNEANTFGIDARAALMKGLVGKATNSLNKTVKQITGGAHLKIGCSANDEEIYYVLVHVVRAYLHGTVPSELEDYLQVRPIEDPVVMGSLESSLEDAIKTRDIEAISILVPDTIEYGVRDHVKFTGLGRHPPADDVFIGALFDYLDAKIGSSEMEFDRLKRMKLVLCDDDGNSPMPYALDKCIFYETELGETTSTYFLTEGKWYEVSLSLIQKLKERLRKFFVENSYPEFTPDLKDEAEYNALLAAFFDNSVLLDKSDILPWTKSRIEPCDIARLENGRLHMVHVKRKTSSATLSHLLNQGVNPWRAIRDDNEVRAKFLDLCEDGGLPRSQVEAAIGNKNVEINYVITTHKPLDGKEANLPIFSRISADRIVSEAHDTGIGVSFTYVKETAIDQSANEVVIEDD